MKEKKVDAYIFDFVYREAVNDATMQKAFTGKKEAILKNNSAKKHLLEYIRSILDGKDLESGFSIISKMLKLDFFDNENFTFGNIQRLVNMTAKYFFIGTYDDKDKRKRFKYCHCPMDSLMIKEVCKRYKEAIKLKNIITEIKWN